MELDSQNSIKLYIDLLTNSMKKKIGILNAIIMISKQQEKLLSDSPFDEESFDQMMHQKEEQIDILIKLEDGFEQIYQRIKDELPKHKYEYKNEIEELQQQVKEVTDLSVTIETLEKRNKNKLEVSILNQRNIIKNGRLNNKTVSNYYKNIMHQQSSSYFYDKKN